MTVSEVKKTIDYRDICYFIKHVPFVNTRIDILKELGYKVIPKKIINSKKEYVYSVNKWNGSFYIQVTKQMTNKNFAWFVKYSTTN